MPLPSILYANVRSVIPKMDELSHLLKVKNIDIFMCSESWLNEKHTDSIISIEGYTVFREDRTHTIGGGVAAWIKNSIHVRRLACTHPSYFECLSLLLADFDIVVLLLYVSPDTVSKMSASVNDFIIEYVDQILSDKPNMHVILCGDLNRFNVTEVKNSLNLKDLHTKPTYGDAQLDYLLFSDNLANQYSVMDSVPIDNSKVPHISLHAIPLLPYNAGNRNDLSSCYDRVLYDLSDGSINAFLLSLKECSFHDLYLEKDLDKKVELFYAKFLECLSLIPCKTVHMSRRDKPWMTSYVKDLINKRWQAYRCRDFNMYNYYKEKCQREIVRCKRSWAKKSRSSSRGIWNVVAEIQGKNGTRSLSSLFSLFHDDLQAANEINKIFTECFNPSCLVDFPFDDDWCPLSTPFDTFMFLDKLSVNKFTGSDNIPNRFYKLASPFICEPLCHIVNCIISNRYVPTAFKSCVITPIPKCSPVSIKQLRPITLLSVPAKLLEYHVLRQTRPFIKRSLPQYQFAYKSLSSTVSCLISVHDIVTKLLECPDVGACFLMNYDFSKAFDCISHSIMIEKLKSLDFPLGFIRLMSSYLSNRWQRVRIGTTFSLALPVTSGAPQGSLLGPFLFVLYCHDIKPLHSSTSLFMYADDICEVCPVYKSEYAKSVEGVIGEFHNIREWSALNGLRLNSAKTKALCFRKRNFDVIFPFPFCVVDHCKLLGVIWNHSLTWTSHFYHVLKLVSKRLYMLRVLKATLQHDELWLVFCMTIESLLLFSTQLFGPLDFKSKKIVNFVFKRALRIICSSSCRSVCKSKMSSFYGKRETAFKSLYVNSQHPDHALHSIVIHPINGRINVPFCLTNRRQNSFPIFSTLVMNGLTSFDSCL